MPDASQVKIHMLNVGPQKYGDSILAELGNRTVLIDAAHPQNDRASGEHPALQDQLAELLGQNVGRLRVDLLIVTHAHSDHIGCMPSLVEKGLRAEWALVADEKLGWGRAANEPGDSFADASDPVRMLSAALREELHSDSESRRDLEEFVDAAVALEPAYIQMLETLSADLGAQMIRYVGAQDQELARLVAAFQDINLTILGPTSNQLVACAKAIRGRSKENGDAAPNLLAKDGDVISAYLRQVGRAADTADGFKNSQGSFINLQSIVSGFEVAGCKMLFTGDMQLSDPLVSDTTILSSVEKLNKVIADSGPYHFVKLAHHGSKNGINQEIFESLGEGLGEQAFGICCGSLDDQAHPDPLTLDLLKGDSGAHWVRTDRNGLSTVTFVRSAGNIKPRVTVEEGAENDSTVNGTDTSVVSRATSLTAAPTEPPVSPAIPPTVPSPPRRGESRILFGNDTPIEITIRLPNQPIRLTHTIEISGITGTSRSEPDPLEPVRDGLILAGGRKLPELLFVTSREALIANLGEQEATRILNALQNSGHSVLDSLPSGLQSYSEVLPSLRQLLNQKPSVRGVVLLGGYDVIPAQRLDCLPPSLRIDVQSNDDDDNFIVWSDDVYVDMDGDGMPDMPISRIPDGRSPLLVQAALGAANQVTKTRRMGIRNFARPFADAVFRSMSGSDGQFLISQPTTFNQQPAYSLIADQLYLMLHGSDLDGTRFWGEKTPRNAEAVGIDNIPDPCPPVVFTGCCWGALTADTTAARFVSGRPVGVRTTGQSIALTCLKRGATAFIGCTGEHYSPSPSAKLYFGGPMHVSFWKFHGQGEGPASALFKAKAEYAANMPHGQTDPEPKAIEHKILRQYTCLGLGW